MDLKDVLKKISTLPANEQKDFLKLLSEFEDIKKRENAQKHFLDFVRMMWPSFIDGRHHKIMADAFERVIDGSCKRLIINMPPRHTKSEFASYLLPAWFMGRFPEKKIIQSTHTAELAVNFGRKTRNLIDSEEYQKLFPGTKLQIDSKAAGRWSTNKLGEYFAIGVGGAIAGKGADLFIIDDPHTEQEAIMAANDPTIYDKVFDWYTSGPRQRLQPGARIVIVMCMTGDTLVLMADGTEKELRHICRGDLVATYENGSITTAKINNWRSSGFDSVYTIKTQSGRILRANERHPFLVDVDGDRQWIRLKDLKPGMQLVATKAATDHLDQKQNLDCAAHVTPENIIIAKTQMPHIGNLAIMENGKGSLANNAKKEKCIVRDYALNAITKNIFQRRSRNKQENIESKVDMELQLSNMLKWLKSVKTNVTFAVRNLLQKIHAHIGMENYVLTTATTQTKCVDFYAMTATSQLGMGKPQKFYKKPLNIYSVTLDEIISIEKTGYEEVFDVEVDRTENFIANGCVSHNTRWGKRDLTGQIIQSSINRGTGDEWEVIELPAILPSGAPLWPEFWSLDALESLKLELPASKWNAQYQQQPTNEDGAILKREWWREWRKDTPPDVDFILICADTAFTKNNRSDYSAFTVWGIFNNESDSGYNTPNVILLDAVKERLEFPELKARAKEMYSQWNPDAFMIEAKASGLPLIHELRQAGIPVSEFTPTRASGDKIMRANSISDLFASGIVWAPDRKWSDEVIEECAAFPNGDHDDFVDTVIMALMRYRQGGFIQLDSDHRDDEIVRRRADYY